MKRTACLVPLILSLCTACGGDDSGSIELSDLCSAEDGLFVDLLTRTLDCNPALVEFFIPVVPTGEDLEFICAEVFGDQVADGSVVLGSRADANACRDAIASRSCEELNIDLIPECDEVVQGTRETGEDCDSDAQCIGDAYCDRANEEDCGVCVDRRPDAASCTDDDECQGRNCSEGQCLTPAGPGADCNEDDDCLGSLMCNQHLGSCQSTSDWSEGDACQPDTNDCAAFNNDLYCDGMTEECIAFLEIGDDCSASTAACNFLHGEHCDFGVSNKCVGATEVGEAQACNLFMGLVCNEGLMCSGLITGTCIEPASPGDECDAEADLPCPGAIFLECVRGTCQYGESQGTCEL